MVDDEPCVHGWAAIDAALEPIYGDQEPLHMGTVIKFCLGGPDPIDGISAYSRTDGLPHWHLITYGFTELYAKESSDLEVSGYGFELTIRLRRQADETQPPNWVFSFLQNLARYVFSTGNGFSPGHYMDLNGPIALDSETKIRAIAFIEDPELPPIKSPNGSSCFLQIIGITLDELLAIKSWSTQKALDLFIDRLPLCVTDLGRSSLLEDAALASLIRQGVAKDGSMTAWLFVSTASWQQADSPNGNRLRLTLGANGVRDLCAILPGRLPFDRDLSVRSREHLVNFVSGDACSWTVEASGDLCVMLTPPAAIALAQELRPKAGLYSISQFPGFEIEIAKSEIKDSDGKTVEVVG